MATSLQYTFPAIDADLIIRDAFERCGIPNWQEDGLKYDAARRSLNFLLSHWPNRGLNLFTNFQGIIPIVVGQNMYRMPANISKILEAKLVNSNRLLNGTPQSNTTTSFDNTGGGTASIPFNQNPQAGVGCLQTAPNGNISYTYNLNPMTPQAILYVGVTTAVTQVYQLVIECSFLTNPQPQDWITVYQAQSMTYYYGLTQWFSLPNTFTTANWRIRETGGNTLNIAQIYFNIPYYSLPMKPVGRDLFFQFPTNSQSALSTTYWNNRIIDISFDVWALPVEGYQFFVYNAVRQIQDIGSFFNSLDIGPKFVEAATAGLAYKLAQKYAPERISDLDMAYKEVFIEAAKEDTENAESIVNFGLKDI